MRPRLPSSAALSVFTRTYGTKSKRPPRRTGTSERPPTKLRDPLEASQSAQTTNLPEGDLSFTYRPPPTPPTPFSTTLNPLSPFLRPATPPVSEKDLDDLPQYMNPRTRRMIKRSQDPNVIPRLSREDIAEMKKLRNEDPVKWTRTELAKRFSCTPHFVSMWAPLKADLRKERVKKMEVEHKANREKWGERRSLFAEMKQKRKEYW